jgi:hypothetical protein
LSTGERKNFLPHSIRLDFRDWFFLIGRIRAPCNKGVVPPGFADWLKQDVPIRNERGMT